MIDFVLCYRYDRECALLFKEYSVFLSVDDKHKVKVGEPQCTVAATDSGRRVPVRSDELFTVADHDFTKFEITPSVIFFIDIPCQITDSWYRGMLMYTYMYINTCVYVQLCIYINYMHLKCNKLCSTQYTKDPSATFTLFCFI